jgi:hypothetical protein
MLFSELASMCQNLPYRFAVDEQNESIMAMFQRWGTVLPLVIALQRGRLVQVRVPMQIAATQVPEAARQLMMANLMHINFEYAISKVAIDKRDGEIVVYSDLLLADNQLTIDQLSHLIRICLSTAHTVVSAIINALSDKDRESQPSKTEAMEQLLQQFGDPAGEDREEDDREKGGDDDPEREAA